MLIVSWLSLLLYFVAKAYYSLLWKPWRLEKQMRQQGIRGNPYKIFYGDTKEEIKALAEARSRPMDQLNHKIMPRAIPFIHQTVKKYGKISLLWAGTTPRVFISDPEMVKEIFSDKSGNFRIPPVNPLVQLLARGVFSLEGDEWAKRRKVVTQAFHIEKLKRMVPAFLASCAELINKWDELLDTKESCELDVLPEFENLTGDVISRTAFGSSFEEGKRIFELQKEQSELVAEAAQVPYIPGYRFVPTAKNKRRTLVDKEIKASLRAIINGKLKSMETKGSDDTDLLGLLLQFTSADDKQYRITIEDVIEECKLFYFAGEQTTSTLLTWTLLLLSMHPVWQKRARDEVEDICGKSTPDTESINQLKIVNMILHEVLRLYPPVVFLSRRTYKEINVGKFTFVPGVEVALPTIIIHHDPEIWGDDAEEFNPERFSEGFSKASKEGRNAFFPFGWGPKTCLGQNFAMIEAKMALAMILQRFSFEISPSYIHAPSTVLFLKPQHGAHIILHRL